MPTMEQIQPYMPLIVMALNGLVAGFIASLLLGGGGLIRMVLVGIIGAFVGGALIRYQLLTLPVSITNITNRHTARHPDPGLHHRRAHRPHHRALPGRREMSGK